MQTNLIFERNKKFKSPDVHKWQEFPSLVLRWSLFAQFSNFIQHRAADPTMGLSALPVELLTEILKALPWMDVLHMRETCKLVFEATKTRAVWAHLVQEHILSKEVPPRLERPIELYTSHELERLVLRWKSPEIEWTRNDGRPPRERSFSCEAPAFTHLIDGGRWFLVTQKSGAVTYYDLDEETISGVQLIPPQFEPNDIHVALDDDRNSPSPKFNMAFCTVTSAKLRTTGEWWHGVTVWAIVPVLDDARRPVGLSATRVASFPHRRIIRPILSFSLLGSHIAFTCFHRDEFKGYIVAVEWDVIGDNPEYSLRIVATSRTYASSRILLLPQNRLVLVTSETVHAYDYSTIKANTQFLADRQDMLNADLFKSRPFSVSGDKTIHVFCVEGVTKVIIPSMTCVYALALDNVSNESPPLLEIARYPTDISELPCAFGPTRGIVYDLLQQSFMLTTYHFPGGGKPSIPPLYKGTMHSLSKANDFLDLDEQTGRIVLCLKKEAIGYVIDKL